ncbi:MAG TPA: MopE-related protein [Candidatus Saccharimonadales bacterium]|nr:MopE-related protein [Candidatus Saccharimonadales bacterium]
MSTSVLVKVSTAGVTWYVDVAHCTSPGSGSVGDPFCLIQDAICASASTDTISVAPGTYHESLRIRPGTHLTSQTGPVDTIIDGTGQPCTETDFCTKRTGQCSTILFGSGHTSSTILSGFTITGGSGTVQATSGIVAGGGIYVYSSPTITGNVITNNEITGPQNWWLGGGIFVVAGEPVITGNVISGNKILPGAGSSKSPTLAYGSGIYVGFYSRPTITGNTIEGNQAGVAGTANSVGGGGGIALFPNAGTSPVVIDRNVISDNSASLLGGGIEVLGLSGSVSTPAITNNVIVGNLSNDGGGVYTGYTALNLINNTIVQNGAKRGGGINAATVDPNTPVSFTNNIVTGNLITEIGGAGGGIFCFTSVAGYVPFVGFSDLWGNDGNQADGNCLDPNVVSQGNNFSADPAFVDPNARDFELDPNSPAIDTADAAVAPSDDINNDPRGIDGDGTPNSPSMGDVDVGAYEYGAGCAANPEICDGIDNNCNNIIDEGFPDTDGDGLADCVDPDDDNDGVDDQLDCAPLDPTTFGLPVEVSGVDAANVSPTTISYSLEPIGSSTQYELISGLLSRLAWTGDFSESFCLDAASSGGSYVDTRAAPPPGDGWYYMLRAVNSCGEGTFGSPMRDAPRTLGACSNGVVDADGDGSPSDLDCNDSNATVSPLAPEICDNLDNNCDGTTDDFATTCGVGVCASSGSCVAGVDSCTAGTPTTEICDGLDNNCDGATDEGFPDTDGDGIKNCIDPDDDNDGVPDTSDCAPLDAGAFAPPMPVLDLAFTGASATDLQWPTQNDGTETLYDVTTGTYGDTGSLTYPAGSCLVSTPDGFTTDNRPDPPVGSVYYYLVKARNTCGAGTYGTAERDTSPACP